MKKKMEVAYLVFIFLNGVYSFRRWILDCKFYALFNLFSSRFLFIVLLLPCSLVSQPVTSESTRWSVNVEAGIARQIVLDKTFSSVAFSGYSFGGGGSVNYNNEKWQHSTSFYFQRSNLGHQHLGSGFDVNVRSVNAGYDILYIFKRPLSSLFQFKVGGTLDVMNNRREYAGLINNNQSHDFAASLMTAGEVSFEPTRSMEGFSLTNRLQLAVLSAVGQPVYGANSRSVPTDENSKRMSDFVDNLRMLSVGSFLRVKNQLLVSKEISTHHKLAMCYAIDYYHVEHFRAVEQINHRFGIVYSFRF